MPDTAPTTPPQTCSLLIPAHPLLGREENMKLLFDRLMANQTQAMDDSHDWSNSRAREDQRHARNAGTFDKSIDAIVTLAVADYSLSSQVGNTEGQQTVSPARTGTPEEILDTIGTSAAGIATANQTVATSLGNLASALV